MILGVLKWLLGRSSHFLPSLSLFRGKQLGADENGAAAAAPMPKQEEEIDKKIRIDRIVGAERERWSLCLTHLCIFRYGV